MAECWQNTTDIEALREVIRRVQVALNRHPMACDEYDDRSTIKCGWRGAVADIAYELDQALDEHPCGDYPAPCNSDDPETHNGH